jgi:hypothetical protein
MDDTNQNHIFSNQTYNIEVFDHSISSKLTNFLKPKSVCCGSLPGTQGACSAVVWQRQLTFALQRELFSLSSLPLLAKSNAKERYSCGCMARMLQWKFRSWPH